jgi:hypothetical protein
MTEQNPKKNQPKLERLQFKVDNNMSIDEMVESIMSQMPKAKDEPKESPKPKD